MKNSIVQNENSKQKESFMYQILVLVFLIIGNIGAIIGLLNAKIFFYKYKDLFEFFRGGQLGGMFIGMGLLLGFLGILLFFVYSFKKNKNKLIFTVDIVLISTFLVTLSNLARYF